MNWSWIGDNLDVLWEETSRHLWLTVWSLVLGVALAFPLALWSHRNRAVYGVLLAISNVLYSIPSIAFFMLMLSFVSVASPLLVIVPMATYTLVILLRNIVEGLRNTPPAVVDAATAMGYTPMRRLLTVELPLAAPAITAGLRVAAVSTISLVSLASLVGQGGLGQVMFRGFQIDNPVQILAGLVLAVALAIAADIVIVGVNRVVNPWLSVRTGRS
jgi:osmoprotectant transport system permease protein